MELHEEHWLSLRSYVVAFEADGAVARNLAALAARLASVLEQTGVPAHFHGVFIPGHGLLHTRPVDASTAAEDDYFHVRYTKDHALLAFKTLLLEALVTFPRPPRHWSVAVDRYFDYMSHWDEQLPSR
jgi:hypothetical protein